MNTKIIRVKAFDKTDLQGLLFSNENNTSVVIHFPGIWGNFYENLFIEKFSEFYSEINYDFMSVNTRFHDGGSLFGRFESCVMDINSWVDFAKQKDYSTIILQGHSLGAQQIVYYLSQSSSVKINRIILLSPVDNISLYCKNEISNRDKIIKLIKDASQNDMKKLISENIFDQWPISTGTFLNLFDHGTNADIFPFREGTLKNSKLSNLESHIFAVVGEKDFYIHRSAESQVRMLNELHNVNAYMIPNGSHSFEGVEKDIFEKINNWLNL